MHVGSLLAALAIQHGHSHVAPFALAGPIVVLLAGPDIAKHLVDLSRSREAHARSLAAGRLAAASLATG